jgi:hypothetical protein
MIRRVRHLYLAWARVNEPPEMDGSLTYVFKVYYLQTTISVQRYYRVMAVCKLQTTNWELVVAWFKVLFNLKYERKNEAACVSQSARLKNIKLKMSQKACCFLTVRPIIIQLTSTVPQSMGAMLCIAIFLSVTGLRIIMKNISIASLCAEFWTRKCYPLGCDVHVNAVIRW